MHKKKTPVIILLFLIISNIAGAQDMLFPLCERYPASQVFNDRIYYQTNNLAAKSINERNIVSLSNCLDKINDLNSLHYPYDRAEIENTMGILEYFEGNNSLAITHYLKALELFSERKLTEGVNSILNNVAIIFAMVSDYESSKKYLLRAIEVSQPDNIGVTDIFIMNLAETEARMGNHQSAIDLITEFLDKNDKREITISKAILFGIVINSYNKLGKPEKSKEWIETGYSYLVHETGYYEKLVFFTPVMEYLLFKEDYNAVVSIWDSIGLQNEAIIPGMHDHLSYLTTACTMLERFDEAWKYEDIQQKIQKTEYVDIEELISILLVEYESNRSKQVKQSLKEEAFQNDEKERAAHQLIKILFVVLISLFILLYFLLRLNKTRSRYKEKLSAETEKIALINNELKKNNDILEKENSLLDTMISVFAHDLINPFQAILGFSNLMLCDYKMLAKEDFIEYLSMLNDTSFQLKQLLINLRNMWLIQEGKENISLSEFHIMPPIEEIINLYQPLARKKEIRIIHNPGNKLSTVMNKEIFQSVLRNILSNAIKFSNVGENILISSYIKDNRIKISIEDRGTGMSEETRKDLLKKEYLISKPGTTNEKGSGLGLSICIELLELNNGNLDIITNEYSGITVVINIPNANEIKE